MRILRLFPLALIAVSARADLYTLADSGIGNCDNYGGPFRQVGTSFASINISSCTFGGGYLRESDIHAEASAGTGYLQGAIHFVGDQIGAGPSAIASFDFYAGDTTSTALDLAFLITGSGRGVGGGRIKGTLSLSLDGAEFDDTLISFLCCMGGSTFTLDDLANFHITGLPAGIATVKLSLVEDIAEGLVFADITATQVPVPEPSSSVLLFSCLIAAGALGIFRRISTRKKGTDIKTSSLTAAPLGEV